MCNATAGETKENQQTSCSISAADEGCGTWLAGSFDLKEALRESHFPDVTSKASSPKISAVASQVRSVEVDADLALSDMHHNAQSSQVC